MCPSFYGVVSGAEPSRVAFRCVCRVGRVASNKDPKPPSSFRIAFCLHEGNTFIVVGVAWMTVPHGPRQPVKPLEVGVECRTVQEMQAIQVTAQRASTCERSIKQSTAAHATASSLFSRITSFACRQASGHNPSSCFFKGLSRRATAPGRSPRAGRSQLSSRPRSRASASAARGN